MSKLRAYQKFLIAGGVVILMGIIFLFVTIYPFFHEEEHASDATMEKHFTQIEPQLNQLVTMANEDRNLVRIAPDWTALKDNGQWPRPESELGFSMERWNEYKTIFKNIGSSSGINHYSNAVYITMTAKGIVNRGSGKGYVYTLETPAPLVGSTDSFTEEGKVYKKIVDNWYIFYDRE